MQIDETKQVVSDINDLVEQIILKQIVTRAQQNLENIKKEIDKNLTRPFEQDYIYEDHFGSKPSEPQVKDFNGVTIVSRILHQTGTGLRDISGADLLYEIEGVKYLIVQYKRPDEKSYVLSDFPQLKNLIASCPLDCKGHSPERINGLCGSWYSLVDETGKQYLQACEAFETFGASKYIRKSFFKDGLTKETFTELFASCRIGSPTSFVTVQNYINFSLVTNRVIFAVNQFGQF